LIKLRKKYQLITKERDSYRSVLNSYESEMTANPADVNRKRLEDLEEVLAGYRKEVDKEFMAMPNLGKAISSSKPPPAPYAVVQQQQLQQQHPRQVVETTSSASSSEAIMIDDAPIVAAVVEREEGAAESSSGRCGVESTTSLAAAGGGVDVEDAAMQTQQTQEGDFAADGDKIDKKTFTAKMEEWRKEAEEMSGRMREIEGENAKLKEVNEKLREEVEKLNDVLEDRKMKGDYDDASAKVIHMRFNPFEMMKRKKMEELDVLKTENERLLGRIRSLEQGAKDPQGLSQRSDEESKESRAATSKKELDEIKAKINAAELKNKRLVEAFQKTSQDLREAVFRLFGYKLDIPMTKQYKLMSMYADSPNDYLLFNQSGSGEMQLLATEYSDTLADLIDAYLNQADSIPAFLASVTMDLFNKQTLA